MLEGGKCNGKKKEKKRGDPECHGARGQVIVFKKGRESESHLEETFEQKLGKEGVGNRDIWGKSIPVKGIGSAKALLSHA